ncbi:gephyrin isoform X2 [Agrilus planipennis]|nr:gephyrin isoform X2 [Agrilus planipennis]XP_025829757.1 gephyrin isoform X2 [Agrilus planipennis]
MDMIRFVILTVSDSCSKGEKDDEAGPELMSLINNHFGNTSKIEHVEILPDEKSQIKDFLKKWSSHNRSDVIFTVGGTGLSPRDVTPEATKSVIEREVPGISLAILCKSLEITDMAMLSRSVTGIRNNTLIINFPGSTKAVGECFGFIKNVIPHAVALLKNEENLVSDFHGRLQGRRSVSPSKVKTNLVAQRSRVSPYPMVEVAHAIDLILKEISATRETENVDIAESLGRVLAENVYAKDPVPPFPASIKDGYAVISSDKEGIRNVREEAAAGDKPVDQPLQPGEVIRISTGAPLPLGADAVVQVEDTDLIKASDDGSIEMEVKIKVAPRPGQDIRPIGSDISVNSVIIEKGALLTAGHIGVLATVGHHTVAVFRKPCVAVVSTGNELQSPHEKLKPGHIRDSNKLTLLNLLKQYGFEASDAGIAKDNPDSVKAVLTFAFDENDVVVTSGGVSMGEHDLIKQVLVEDFDATILFGRVNVKPGKPTTFATCTFNGRRKFVFGLPGNPVSALVTGTLFVLPGLKKMENYENLRPPVISVRLNKKMILDPRPEYIRARLRKCSNDDILEAIPTGNQISSRINSFVGASALVRLPAKNSQGFGEICDEGTVLEAILIQPLSIEYV